MKDYIDKSIETIDNILKSTLPKVDMKSKITHGHNMCYLVGYKEALLDIKYILEGKK